MNFFHRALRSIERLKSRTLFMSLIFFMISFLILVGISVLYTSENAITRAKSEMNPIVVVRSALDADNYLDIRNNNLRLSEKLERMIQDERIVTWNQCVEMKQKSVNFDSYTVMEDDRGSTSLNYEMNVSLFGNKASDCIEFHNGSYELTEGRFYNEEELKYHDYVCVIDEKLAEVNGIKIGDTIITQSFANSVDVEDSEFHYSWKVIGFYRHCISKNPQFSETRQVIYDQELQENTIIVPGTTLAGISAAYMNGMEMILGEREKSEPIHWEEEDQYSSEIILMLDSPELLEPFIQEYSRISDGIYTLESNNALYEKYGKPLNVIQYFALIILAVVVGNGILLILFLSALQIQNRSNEIGIYLSVGVPRHKIIMQFFIEMMIEMLIGTTIAGMCALWIVKPLNDQLLTLTVIQKQTEFLDADEDLSYSEAEKYFSEIDPEKILDQFQVELTGREIIACLICEGGILLMSLGLTSPTILKMKPKKILT